MRVVFLGTPEFALKPLEALVRSRHEVVAVVTQPDKPKGRNNRLQSPPVKEHAVNAGLKVLQYSKIRNEGVGELAELKADIMVTAAYGQILSQEILNIPKFGVINVHASLLPKYRGAMPVQWAVINGEKKTGITIMQTDAGLDSGDILLQEELEIGATETAGEILSILSEMGAKCLIRVLDLLEKSSLTPVKQNAEFTYFPIIKKEDGLIDWNKTAADINNLVRGLNPAPVAYTMLNGEVMKIWSAKVVDSADSAICPGMAIVSDGALFVKCGAGMLEIAELQFPNSKRMTARAYLNGKKIPTGTLLK